MNTLRHVGVEQTAELRDIGLADDHRAGILQARDEIGRREGILLCPEGAATWAAYKQSLADGRIKPTDRAVLYNCATGLKYPLPEITRTLDRHQPIDYAKLAQT